MKAALLQQVSRPLPSASTVHSRNTLYRVTVVYHHTQAAKWLQLHFRTSHQLTRGSIINRSRVTWPGHPPNQCTLRPVLSCLPGSQQVSSESVRSTDIFRRQTVWVTLFSGAQEVITTKFRCLGSFISLHVGGTPSPSRPQSIIHNVSVTSSTTLLFNSYRSTLCLKNYTLLISAITLPNVNRFL